MNNCSASFQIFAIISIVRFNHINKVEDIVLNFYRMISSAYDMKVEKKAEGECCIVHSNIVKDEFNNFAYFPSHKGYKKHQNEARQDLQDLDRKGAIYFQSARNENINEIMAKVKNNRLLFHDVWMKLKNGYNPQFKKCLLENVIYKKAEMKDYENLLYVFKEGFRIDSGNEK